MFTLPELEAAAEVVGRHMPPTPQYHWPLLSRRAGCEVIVKHENHTPIGAFKVRGGIVYMDELMRSGARIDGVITATRGNHGQSVARAASAVGLKSVILVPHGNSAEKNTAMRAFGAELIEHGVDFDEAKDEAYRLAETRNLHIVPTYHAALVKGVATAGRELLTAVPDLDTVYVPIGMGSGVGGMIMARDLLGAEDRGRRRRRGQCAVRRALGRRRQADRHQHARRRSPTAWRAACPIRPRSRSSRAALRASSASARTRSRTPCAPTTRIPTTLPRAPARPPSPR